MKGFIWFDMDGTIADLYGVDNWLTDLRAGNTRPYAEAQPLLRMQSLARTLNRLKRDGYGIGIVSWLSKGGSPRYNEAVKEAKKAWLRAHLASVDFDRIDIIEYGTPKHEGRGGILFDDEKPNRDNWRGLAFSEKNIMEVLKSL